MRLKILIYQLALVLVACSNAIHAQQYSATEVLDMRRVANDQLQLGEYERSFELFKQLTILNPYDGSLWLALGQSASQLGHDRDAIVAYQKALEVGAGNVPGPGFRSSIHLEIARANARLGEDEASFAAMEAALSARLPSRNLLQEDEAFRRYHGEKRFERLLQRQPEQGLSRDAGWRFDLDLLAEEVARIHVNPDGPRASPEFVAALDQLRARIPELTNGGAFLELMRAVVRLGDGHSSVFPTPAADIPLTLLPIDLYVFSDGIFIVNGEGEAARWVGSQVLEVENRPSDEVLHALAEYVPKDNPMGLKWNGPFMLTVPLVLQHIGVSDSTDNVQMTLLDPQGAKHTVELQGGPFRMPPSLPVPSAARSPLPLSMQDVDSNYWYRHVPEQHAMYLQFNQVIEMPNLSIPAFVDQLAQALGDSKLPNLIVDVRRNNGGDNFHNRALLRLLVHFEMQSPEHQIFVLVGRNTFSAAQNLITRIEGITNAMFIGEPSSSRPNHIGEDGMLLLPHSGLAASISSRYFQDSEPTDDRIWIAPDIVVELSSVDYFAGEDPALGAVYEIIRSRQ